MQHRICNNIVSMTYAKNYLDSVVLEIRFDDVSLSKLNEFKSNLLEKYPIQKQENGFEGYVNVDMLNGVVDQSKKEKIIWTLAVDDGTNKVLRLSNDFIILEYNNQIYTSSSELVSDVDNVINKFITTFNVGIINRIGLRYVNKIPAKEGSEILGAKDLISKELVEPYTFMADTKSLDGIARSISQQHLKFSDSELNFVFGIWNNDFPNRIVSEDFILDYDCFTNLPVKADEINITDTVVKFNAHIEQLFEKSITDKTRSRMGSA